MVLLLEPQEEVQEHTVLCTQDADARDQASRLLHSIATPGRIRINTRGSYQPSLHRLDHVRSCVTYNQHIRFPNITVASFAICEQRISMGIARHEVW